MIIKLQQSGGFAGMSRTKSINISELSETKQKKIVALVKQVDFFSLPAILSHEGEEEKTRDMFEYKITCTYDKKTHSVTCTDMTKRPIEPLLSWIKKTSEI